MAYGPDQRPHLQVGTGRNLVLLVRSGPVIRDSGGSVRIWGDNGPVLISYFYDGAVPVKVFQNRSQSDFYMDNFRSFSVPSPPQPRR